MELLTPDPGLLFWTFITFSLLVFVLGKFAWKPILHAIKVREESIEYSLKEADKARRDVQNLELTKRQMMDEARSGRDTLLKEAREIRNTIIEEARQAAKKEADKLVASARQQIESEKVAAVEDLKRQVAILSVDIASKLLGKELESSDKQRELINQYLNEVSFN
jgi:F-type H+-transporting ATPase subunit b